MLIYIYIYVYIHAFTHHIPTYNLMILMDDSPRGFMFTQLHPFSSAAASIASSSSPEAPRAAARFLGNGHDLPPGQATITTYTTIYLVGGFNTPGK